MEHLIDPAAVTAHDAFARGNLLDVRPSADFHAGHVAGACHRPLPLPGPPDRPWPGPLVERALPPVLLPPRHEPLLLFAATPAAAAWLRDRLRGRGRSRADACALDADGLRRLPESAHAVGPGAVALWRPPSFLVDHHRLLPPPEVGPVLDLGAGAGRAAVWLAARGWRVTAVDRHPEALASAALVAATAPVGPGRLTLCVRDLRDPAQVPAGPWAAVLAFRYLDRDLLRRLPRLLLPGGVAMVRTFRRAAAAERPISPVYLLDPGELARLFPSPPFRHLVHVEDHDPDGHAAAGIVASFQP